MMDVGESTISLVDRPRRRAAALFAGNVDPEPAVRCRGLAKTFESGGMRVEALGGIDLEIMPGEITLLVGPSGCGKTTLISIVAGLLNPSAGSLHVLGNDLAAMSSEELVDFRARNLGFVFQQYNLLPALSAAENACLPLMVAGIPRRAALMATREVLARVGLQRRADAYPAQLSGGEQQRVAIARALVHKPRLLVCDEPTAALDAQAGQKVMELFSEVAVEPDRAVIIVTHDNRVLHYGQRIIQMSDGRIERVQSHEDDRDMM
jgi:putative ABC transport system ATP-binding protein